MEIMQHFCARHIDEGRRRKAADDELDVRVCHRCAQHRLHDGFGIDIEQRGFGPKRDDAFEQLDFRIARAVGIAAGSG